MLKVVMSYSLPRDLLLLGKWVGGYLPLIPPLVVAFVIGLLIMILFAGVEVGFDHTLAILALLGMALLCLAAIYSLGILVSCRTRIPSTTITVLLLVWMIFILVIPNTAPYITSQLLPVRSRERAKVWIENRPRSCRQVRTRSTPSWRPCQSQVSTPWRTEPRVSG